MAYAQPQAWYVHAGDGATSGYYATPTYSNKAWTGGQLVRPLTAPAVGNERVYVCTIAGTSTVEPTWTFTKGAPQSATGATFTECTGECALNGDLTNALQWTASSAPVLGRVIYDPTSNSLQICTTASGNGLAAKPTFSATAGTVTSDSANRWTSLGLASAFGAWAAPHARLANAFVANWGAAGNDFYVADNSAEVSSAAITLNTGAPSLPSRIFSVDHTASLPPAAAALKPGASFASSLAGNNAINIQNSGATEAYYFGLTFIASGVAAQPLTALSGPAQAARFDSCSFRLTGASSTSVISFGSSTAFYDLVNCTFGLTNAAQILQFSGAPITWRNTADPVFLSGSIGGATFVIPATAMRISAPSNLLIEGVDFTSLGANGLVLGSQGGGSVTVKNCKLHTGAIVSGLTSGGAALIVDVVNSDSGSAIYRNERYGYYGSQTTSTSAVRTGGATDGTTPVSHQIVGASIDKPFKGYNAIPLVIWNDVVGAARTLTVFGALAGGSQPLPFNDAFWIDVEYMGSASSPVASVATTGLATFLSTHVQNAVADGSSWSGGASTPFSLSTTFTAQQKGYVTVYPKASNLSLSLDPRPVLS